ncbi:MAG TPA: cytochrome b [Cellvibrionaceae bacterium]|nr:cytochrome b [Cellvibrionaceae bacterium]HMW48481.1 cytochrome b [Cellvibrionaceae bacterium]HMW73192.1 cytochrome b [Cellvibrionaceae bacterium]HMY40095.1 cytochrome b [Marinagarivorans sp.]HNG60172.1 cytochrome b [Cellvibrionaceae bacterium]
MNNSTGVSFSRPLIILHWAVAALVLALLAAVELHEVFPKDSLMRGLFMKTHFWLGLSVGLLTLVRLWLRWGQHPAPITPAPALWQTRLAAGVQWAFYGILLVMPVLGYLLINAKGFDLSLGPISLGHWVAADKELVETLEELHETLGNVFIALVALHTVAALYHHHILKDSTFSRLQPPA